MGPFQEYEEKKSPEKGSPRSRIPRLVLLPFRPKDKGSGVSESQTSEEEGKECDLSSDHSKRTISTNSFCSGSEQSPDSSPPLLAPQRPPPGVKRVRLMAERSAATRHKREQRSGAKSRGSEADFSSSSSTRSLKSKEGVFPGSAGRKRTARPRPLPVFKPAGTAMANRDSELFAPYRTPPRPGTSTTVISSSSSSNNSSPSTRRVKLGRYHSCGDNHGILPPHPEQYLTPLQQKEVNIRHLKTKLMECETIIHDREADVEELKSQLGRMREDWIEEECHRVEAQLSLKEARREIRQLRQVVDTMKSSLMEKDKGIQKYFIDINIQNRKLESLLQSMELAQSGSNLQDDPSLDFLCDGSGRRKAEEGEALGDQAAEEMADSGLLLNDEMANRADILEQVLMSTAVDFNQEIGGNSRRLGEGEGPGVSTLLLEEEKVAEKSNLFSTATAVHQNPSSTAPKAEPPKAEPPKAEHKEMQTDMTPASPDLQALLLQLLKLHGGMVGDGAHLATSPAPTLAATTTTVPTTTATTANATTTTIITAAAADSTACTPSPDPIGTPGCSSDSGVYSAAEPADGRKFMEELDFSVCQEEALHGRASDGVVAAANNKRYWSSSFLVDLVAVAAPVLPTVAWLYARHGVDGSAPVYNISALIRGCCIMGLRSLRHTA